MSADTKGRKATSPAPVSPSLSHEGSVAAKGLEPRRRRRFGLAVLLVALALILLVFLFPGKRLEGEARSGSIDAYSVGDGAIVLAGEWEVLEESQASGGERRRFAVLPEKWAKPYGYAAYRLRVRDLDPKRSYALSTSYIDTSYRLWVDGSVLLSGGSPGRSEAETRSAYNASMASIPAGRTEVELKLEVANFVHLRGGPYRGILLGDQGYLRRYDTWSFVSELVTIGIMVSLSGIACMSALVRRSQSSLWYGLMCVSGAAGLFLLSPDFPAFRIFPDLSWDAYVRVSFSLVYLTPLWFFRVAASLFGGVSPKNAAIISLPAAALALLALVLPLKLVANANPVFMLNGLVLFALAVVIFGRAVLKSYPYARLLSLGFAVFLSIALGVLLFSNDRIYRGAFSALSFLYPLFGLGLSSSFPLDIASYVLAILSLNAFSVLFFIDAPKLEQPSPALAEPSGLERTRAKCEELGLSPREVEVTLLLLEGKRNKEIAEALFVSENTVKTHLARIFDKAGVKARSELFAIFAWR
jgi:DNA-binding CsgD family transcriptional regulator